MNGAAKVLLLLRISQDAGGVLLCDIYLWRLRDWLWAKSHTEGAKASSPPQDLKSLFAWLIKKIIATKTKENEKSGNIVSLKLEQYQIFSSAAS